MSNESRAANDVPQAAERKCRSAEFCPHRANLRSLRMVAGIRRHLPLLVSVCVAVTISVVSGLAAGTGFLLVGLSFTALLAVLLVFIAKENVRVERLVEERTVQLVRTQEELASGEKLAVLGQIAGGVAHELRNPLGTIQNAVYLLNIELGRELAPGAAGHLRVINEEVERSNRIITGLLDFAEGRPVAAGPARVADLVDDAVELARLPSGVKLTVSIPEDLPDVMVDEGQIVQVLLNVLTNARQALAGAGRIALTASPSGDMVEIRICDSGPGVGSEQMALVFEPLFSTRTFGVGFGLPVCRMFVEANHGTIGLASEPGKGTTVTVALPAAVHGHSCAGPDFVAAEPARRDAR